MVDKIRKSQNKLIKRSKLSNMVDKIKKSQNKLTFSNTFDKFLKEFEIFKGFLSCLNLFRRDNLDLDDKFRLKKLIKRRFKSDSKPNLGLS